MKIVFIVKFLILWKHYNNEQFEALLLECAHPWFKLYIFRVSLRWYRPLL